MTTAIALLDYAFRDFQAEITGHTLFVFGYVAAFFGYCGALVSRLWKHGHRHISWHYVFGMLAAVVLLLAHSHVVYRLGHEHGVGDHHDLSRPAGSDILSNVRHGNSK